MSARVTILSPGLFTLPVAAPRMRTRSLGVPVGGPADRVSHTLGNLLIGNPPDACALEVTFAGPTLTADAPLACVVFGAPFDLATERGPLRPGATFTLEAGEVLRIGGARTGARAYLCVRGGLEVPEVLGSRSALAPLRAGAVIGAASGRASGRELSLSRSSATLPVPEMWEGGVALLRVLPGAQASWLPPLLGRLTVGTAADRMGVRLSGPPLDVPPREIASEPVCPGTVQVTRGGEALLLGVDGQTIGGYPKVAHVIAADLPRVGQLRPGQAVEMQAATLDEAEAALAEMEAELRRWRALLETGGEGRL
jgi:antagonist of KipI